MVAKKLQKTPALADLAFYWARGTLITKKASGSKNIEIQQGDGTDGDR